MLKDDRMMGMFTFVVVMVAIGTMIQRADLMSRVFGDHKVAVQLVNDEAIVRANELSPIDVLANDIGLSDRDRENLVIVEQPTCGRVFMRDGMPHYLPAERCVGSQTFRYGISGRSDLSATVTAVVRLAEPVQEQVAADAQRDVTTRAPQAPASTVRPGGATPTVLAARPQSDPLAAGPAASAPVVPVPEPTEAGASPGTNTPGDAAHGPTPDANAQAPGLSGAGTTAAASVGIAPARPAVDREAATTSADGVARVVPAPGYAQPAPTAPEGPRIFHPAPQSSGAPDIAASNSEWTGPVASGAGQTGGAAGPVAGAGNRAGVTGTSGGGLDGGLASVDPAQTRVPAPPVTQAPPVTPAPLVTPAPAPVTTMPVTTMPVQPPAQPPQAPAAAAPPQTRTAAANPVAPAPFPASPSPGNAQRAVPNQPCTVPATLTLAVKPAGITEVAIDAPCQRGTAAELSYDTLRFAMPIDGAGQGRVEAVGLQPMSAAVLTFADGSTRRFDISFNDTQRLERVAIVYDMPVDLELHAFEFGARPDSSGHVGPDRPRSYSDVRREGGGYLMTYNPVGGVGQSLRVYTFWLRHGGPTGVVKLKLDFASRDGGGQPDTCGAGKLADPEYRVLRSVAGKLERPQLRRLVALGCDAVARPENRFIADAVDDLIVRRR